MSIDQEIVEKLKQESNYSEVVNEQMKAFYAANNCENLGILKQKLAETKQILKENRKKRREIEAQINKIDAKTKRIKAAFKQKGLTRSRLIDQIREKRAAENSNSYRKVSYFITPEEEADKILKGRTE